jgi:hypothetical protein
MYEILEKRVLIECLIRWVKVVYANELRPHRGSLISQKDLMDLNHSKFNKDLYSPDDFNILNSYQSNPSSQAMNPLATMPTRKMDEDDCFMDDVGNEGIKLIGVACDGRSDQDFFCEETPIEHVKISEDSVRKSKE